MLESLVATGALLAVLSLALGFFSRSQVVYTNERATLDMVQDLRTVFDRFTNETRMSGAGLPGYHGVISGTVNSMVLRGDFSNITTIVSSTGASSGGVFSVGTTARFAAGQTVSLLNTVSGAAALAKITNVDSTASTLTVNPSDLLAITSGAGINDFGAGTIINVIERRTYRVITDRNNPDYGAITFASSYENTQSSGTVISPEAVIGRNVIKENGDVGLTFTFLDKNETALAFDPATGLVDPSRVVKVKIELQARSANKDLDSKNYRTLKMTSLIQVRGQYLPGVGF